MKSNENIMKYFATSLYQRCYDNALCKATKSKLEKEVYSRQADGIVISAKVRGYNLYE